ncbi:MAG: RNA methyltransferase [Rhodocyclales bacterium]|nr:RNA methyltransferase [Rhodocyclales bacterium]
MKKITSRDNATFKQLRLLAESSRERRKQGKTVLDGIHLVSAWFDRYGPPVLLAVSESGARQTEIREFLSLHPQTVPQVFGDALFKEVSPVTTPTGILALISIPHPPPAATLTDSCVLLEAIQDAGNLGSILRSAAAAGIADIFLGPGCAQAWSPRVLRAAMGAHFLLRVHEHAVLDQVINNFDGISVSTRPDANATIFELDLTGPVAWVFGNEGVGLTAGTAGLTHHAVRIPMPGKAESLNVAAATSICLFEEVRQKMTKTS